MKASDEDRLPDSEVLGQVCSCLGTPLVSFC